MRALALLLAAIPASVAATPFGLPAEELANVWGIALADVGFEPGTTGGEGAWVRLDRVAGGCALLVNSGRGGLQRELVPCPDSEAEREELAALAAVMLAPLVTMAVPEMPPVVVAPAPVRAVAASPPRHPPVPVGSEPLAAPMGIATPEPPPASAEPPPSPFTEIVTGPLATAPTPSTPDAQGGAGTAGAWNVRTTLCNVDFDLPCATTARCSTAERCPGVWFLDTDRDGYSSGTTSRLESELGRVLRDHWVQLVGDMDDTDPNVHPRP